MENLPHADNGGPFLFDTEVEAPRFEVDKHIWCAPLMPGVGLLRVLLPAGGSG